MEFQRDGFLISNDPSRLDLDVIYHYLSTESYWSAGIPREVVEKAVQNSLPFGVYDTRINKQIGFARLITDYATFAYLADVFVLPEYRGQGLSKWLMACIRNHPDLQGLRRMLLATRDAHGLYSQYGFKPLAAPDRWMEVHDPEVYRKK